MFEKKVPNLNFNIVFELREIIYVYVNYIHIF